MITAREALKAPRDNIAIKAIVGGDFSAAHIGLYGNFCFITVAGVQKKRHKSD